MPAALTRPSRPPMRSSAWFTAAWTAAGSVTSAQTGWAERAFAFMATPSSVLSSRTSSAPSAANNSAMAAPMPDPAPVMRIRLPSSRFFIVGTSMASVRKRAGGSSGCSGLLLFHANFWIDLPEPGCVLPQDLLHVFRGNRIDTQLPCYVAKALEHADGHVGVRVLGAETQLVIAAQIADPLHGLERRFGTKPPPVRKIDVEIFPLGNDRETLLHPGPGDMGNDHLQIRKARADIIEQIRLLVPHRRVLARCPTHMDLHRHIQIDECLVNRIEPFVARVEVII